MMKSFICAIGTANPPHKIPQMQIAGFMADALEFDERERRKLQALYKVSGIDYRYTVLEDYGRQNGDYTFYPNTPGLLPVPSIRPRMEIYREHALQLSADAVKACMQQVAGEVLLQDITHLITVSCTGMYAPGLDIELVETLDLPTHVQRTAVNFMGCYAAFNALKLADAICRSTANARVLVVCTEICTIHFQNSRETDHLLSNAIFGDGSAAVLMQSRPTSGANLSLESFYCELVPAGKKEMAWHITDSGFEMTLSSYVPDMIRSGIRMLTDKLLQHLELSLSEIDLFAIHPGGRKILEVIEQELGLSREDNRFAYQVLRDFGNMSSVTILFVLQALLQSLRPEHHSQPVLSFAFGPGLTLESMLLKVSHV